MNLRDIGRWFSKYFILDFFNRAENTPPEETSPSANLLANEFHSINQLPATGAEGNYLAIGAQIEHIYCLFQTMLNDCQNQDVLIIDISNRFKPRYKNNSTQLFCSFNTNRDIWFLLLHIKKNWFKQTPLIIIGNLENLSQENKKFLSNLFYQKKFQLWLHSHCLNQIREIFGNSFFGECREALFFNLNDCNFTSDSGLLRELRQIPAKHYAGILPERFYQLFPHFKSKTRKKSTSIKLDKTTLCKTTI